MKKRYILLVLVVAFGVTFWLLLRTTKPPTVQDANPVAQNGLAPDAPPAEKDDMIIVTRPLAQSKVISPLTITGNARGNWYNEAVFPVVLVNATGATIASGQARAQGAWTTTDYVPFTAALTFTAPQPGTTGTLILKKDNESGNPINDNAIQIPVTF